MFWKRLYLISLTVLLLVGCAEDAPRQLVILHTNDSHSQVEPTAKGQGGFAARAELIDSIRQAHPDLLLLDAGDMVQGTPYFNFYHGRIETEAYNRMGYDAITLGNHEFDYGVDTLAAWLSDANFAVVCCNYDVLGTPLADIVKPYVVINRGGLKVGIIGLGVNPEGLILQTNFAPLRFMEPIERANHYADSLKQSGAADFIIALSHLGYQALEGEASDSLLARKSRHIDIILGGHTHADRGIFHIPNLDGRDVVVMKTAKSSVEIDKVVVSF